jgi:uncharacterized protein involved in exopolysaccharide biosynthesis
VISTSIHQYEEEIDLLRYGRFLAAYWMVVCTGAVVGVLGGVAVSSSIPHRYQATATLLVTPPTGATPLVLSPAAAKALVANPTIVSETLTESGLNRDGMTTQSFINDALDVQPIPSTNIIRVSVTARDPSQARVASTLLANKVVVKSHGIDRAGETTARDDLEKQIAEAKTNLNKAEQRLLDLQVSYEVEFLEAEVQSKVARRVDVDAVDTELEAERARLSTLQQELERQPARLGVPQVRDDPETDRFANPVYTMLQYDIAQSKAKIASLERKRGQTVGATGGKAVTNQRGELYRRRFDLARLQAVYDANNRIYADLVARYEQARARTAGSAPQLKMLDDAALPDQPIPQRRAQWGLFGGLIGLLLGIAAALLINIRREPQLAAS